MKADKIRRFVRERVLENLEQEFDAGLRASAMQALCAVVRANPVPRDLLERVVPVLEREIEQPRSPVRTETFEAIAALGRVDVLLVEALLDPFLAELARQNRFRAPTILQFLADVSTSRHPRIQAAIRDLLRVDYQHFEPTYLRPHLVDFVAQVTQKGFQFENQYGPEIAQFLAQLPPGWQEIRDHLGGYRAAHEKFVERARERKREEERRRRELEARREREQEREREREQLGRQDREQRAREKKEREKKEREKREREDQRTSGPGASRGQEGSPAASGGGIRAGGSPVPAPTPTPAPEPESSGSKWPTFSGFGLRRRTKRDEKDECDECDERDEHEEGEVPGPTAD